MCVSSIPLKTSFTGDTWNYRFDFNESFGLEIPLVDKIVRNDALLQIYCNLFSSSTKNISLLIEPDDWNVTRIPLAIGQEVNVTVTNGEVLERRLDSDIAAFFSLILQRENITDEVHGLLSVIVLDIGWQIAPWPIVSGVIALFFLLIRHKQKNPKRRAWMK